MNPSALSPFLLVPAIVVARICDVSIGTLRTIVVFRGYRLLAAALGFVEVTIWLIAAGQVIRNLDAWYLVVAYAGGFAAGNVAGIWLESKLAIGSELVRAVSANPAIGLASELRRAGYETIELPGHGAGGAPIEVLLVVERRKRIPALLRLIRSVDPEAYWTITDVKRRPEEGRARRFMSMPDWIRVAKRK
jgi:uncharacterized protein YebE (UPF0316 family)